METHLVKIIAIHPRTHDVRSYRVEKPEGYSFIPGQATEVAINKPAWKNEKRPFTFTSLQDEPTLEFTIKSYQDHPGVTNELWQLQAGDSLLIHDVWGAIAYKGPGYFIAGGAGITPFIAILRQLNKDNQLAGNHLFFANKTREDIILEAELKTMLGPAAHFILSQEDAGGGYENGYIDAAYLQQHVTDFSKHFYVCGPPPMVTAINKTLVNLGATPEAVVFEQ